MKRLSILAALSLLLALSATVASAGTQPPTNGAAAVQTPTQPTMVQLAVGGQEHACGISPDGTLVCWGNNGYGELGDGTTLARPYPVFVPGMAGVTTIAAGRFHTCAVVNGGAKCWGWGGTELGTGPADGQPHPTPADVRLADSTPLSGVTAIATGQGHTCAVVSGGVLCWGDNQYGQLGNGAWSPSSTPVAVPGLSNIIAVTAGSFHTCALTSGGNVKCWGRNYEGELGNKTSGQGINTPVDVVASSSSSTPLSGVTRLNAGDNHTCAVVNGGAKCWGSNQYGQLGNPSTPTTAPLDVTGLTSGVSSIAGGFGHTCALTTNGGVKCWGYNLHGQLGDGTTTQRTTPVAVSGLASGVSAVDTGGEASCALMTTGKVKCWGYNHLAQLGIGAADLDQHLVPVDLALLTTAAVTSSANPAIAGQTLVYTATVDSGDPSRIPVGNVTFYDGTTQLGMHTLDVSGQITHSVTATGLGSHSIKAVYAGGLGFGPSTSPVFTQTIKVGTATTLSAPPNVELGGSVVFTATVTVLPPGTGQPTGTVAFRDGTNPLAGCGTLALSSTRTATCTSGALSVGSHAITASYSGEGDFISSTSAPLNLNVFRLYIPLMIKP